MAAYTEEGAAKKLQKSNFDLLGLCCTSEVPLIEKILRSLDGVKEVTTIVPSRTVIVVHDTLLLSQVQIDSISHLFVKDQKLRENSHWISVVLNSDGYSFKSSSTSSISSDWIRRFRGYRSHVR
ncbi:unnamed protein product [Ilex paraguariensis]